MVSFVDPQKVQRSNMEVNEPVVSTTTGEDGDPPKPCSFGPRGEAVQIVKIDDEGDHSFYLDEEALSNIMDDDRIRDKPLCIISVAGKICRQIGLVCVSHCESLFQEPFEEASPFCWTSCCAICPGEGRLTGWVKARTTGFR